MSRPGSYSLQSRLLVSVSILLAVFLGLTGVVLDRAFRASAEAGIAEQLQVQIYVLLAAVDQSDGDFYFIEDLREPRFSQLNSGLYGLIRDADGQVLLRTPSALELAVNELALGRELSRGDTQFRRLAGASELEFFVSSYAVTWENRPAPVIFTVLEDTATYQLEVNQFRRSLWSWLGGLAALLLLLQLALLRWGLAPLRRLARDLVSIERGDSETLGEDYPRELNAVTTNLNLLIQSERKQQQRYRTTLGDLAHSLKTPLAVIQGEMAGLRSGPDHAGATASDTVRADVIQEQLDAMNQIVGYQLQRAVRGDNTSALARQVNLAEATARVARALEKVYADKSVKITQQVDEQTFFLGDERDLMEVLGNLMDNACKYGRGRVLVSSSSVGTDSGAAQLRVEDDGSGILPEANELVLQRGVRLDTLPQGQGIGLAVVADIVHSYGGQIQIERSSLGGAAVIVTLNNIRVSNLRESTAR
ncbi:ATP-binding protein [Pseudohongiella sp. O18]|uniref:ATP-binding protein n=1 Tax=Pseudohongiella sp. O18 TaxID=2904248 RepID=UPI001F213B0D|nr:ATP-binding protein [Pseudohongiella sp. O18]